MNELELTGQVRTHVVQYVEPRMALQPIVAEALLDMKYEAGKTGIIINPISTFRDFKTQLKIWNNKFSGKRDLLSIDGSILDRESLSTTELIIAILRWSALPGASRHHWGTEIDVVDLSTIPSNYRVQLVPEEFENSGPFEDLRIWMNGNLKRFGFFQPYKKAGLGVCPEPWHISFKAIAEEALENLTLAVIERTLKANFIFGKKEITKQLPEIYERFVINIDP